MTAKSIPDDGMPKHCQHNISSAETSLIAFSAAKTVYKSDIVLVYTISRKTWSVVKDTGYKCASQAVHC